MKVPAGKGLWIVKVGEKGQIVIPKDAREMFEINPGDSIVLLGDIKQGLAIAGPSTLADLGSFLMEDVDQEEGGPNA